MACNTYATPERDIMLMTQLEFNAYRFSIAWTRVIPQCRRQVNQKVLDYYDCLLDLLLERNITPFITFFHFDTSQAIQDLCGGFAGRGIIRSQE